MHYRLMTGCEMCVSYLASHSNARQWRDLAGLMRHVRISRLLLKVKFVHEGAT